MSDAPGAHKAVNIVVDSIRVHVESGDTLGVWYTISRSTAQYNLLAYANGRDTVIAEGSIPAAYYSQMRLYIGNGSHVIRDGVRSPLKVVPADVTYQDTTLTNVVVSVAQNIEG